MRRALPTTLLLLLAVAAAAGPPIGTLEAAAVGAEGYAAEGTLGALRTSALAGATLLAIEGSASRVHIQADDNHGYAVSGTDARDKEPSSTPYDHGASTIQATAFRAAAQAFAVGLDGAAVTLEGDAARLEAPRVAHVSEARMVYPLEPELDRAVASHAALDASGATTVHLRGDIVLSLWDIDLLLDDGEAVTYESGQRAEAIAPSVAGFRTVEEHRPRQLYVHLTDADVTLRVEGAGTTAFVATPSVRAASLRLEAPQGTLRAADRELELLGGELVLEEAAVRIGAPAGGLPIVVDDAAGARMDGEPIELATGQVRRIGSELWVVAGVGLVALAAGTGSGLRRRTAQEMARLEAAMAEARYEDVAGMGNALLRSRRFGQEAGVIRCVALLRLGRAAEAKRTVQRMRARGSGSAAMQDYLLAHALCLEGEFDEAGERLAACLRRAPSMRTEVLANPVFRPLLEHPPREGYA